MLRWARGRCTFKQLAQAPACRSPTQRQHVPQVPVWTGATTAPGFAAKPSCLASTLPAAEGGRQEGLHQLRLQAGQQRQHTGTGGDGWEGGKERRRWLQWCS